MHLYEINRVKSCSKNTLLSFATPSRIGDKLIVLGYVAHTVKPPDTTVDVNHETQPSTIRDEKGGGSALRNIVEEFLVCMLGS